MTARHVRTRTSSTSGVYVVYDAPSTLAVATGTATLPMIGAIVSSDASSSMPPNVRPDDV